MGEKRPGQSLPYMEGLRADQGWSTVRLQQSFAVEVGDLIENFMDGPHTAFVHTGIIRTPAEPRPRKVRVSGDQSGLKVDHEPSVEHLPLLRLIGKKGPVQVRHTDAFWAPTNVKVDYWLGEDEPSFSALIAMAPNGPCQTEVFVSVSVRLGALNKPASLGLGLLARHILKQDANILALQRRNLEALSERPTVSVESDYPDIQIRALRDWLRKPSTEEPFVVKAREFTLYL